MGKKRSSTSLPFDYSSSFITGLHGKKGRRKRSLPNVETQCDNFKKLCLQEESSGPVTVSTQSESLEQSFSYRSDNNIVNRVSSTNLYPGTDHLGSTPDIVNSSSGSEAFGVQECSFGEPSFSSNSTAQDTGTVDAKITEGEIDEIISGLDKDLESLLDVRPMKSQLTTEKVKRILRHIISNKHILAMVEKSMDIEEENEQNGGHDGLQKEAASQPKLTQLKVKKLKVKQTVSVNAIPMEKKEKAQPCFDNLMFAEFSDNEDSSDNEYNPGKKKLQIGEELSNTETKEYCTSSDLDSEPDLSSSAIAESGYGSNDSNNDQGHHIALRTRSKLSLVTTPSKSIGPSVVLPDIAHNVHDSDYSNKVWVEFLKSLRNPSDEQSTPEGEEEDDPDYIDTVNVNYNSEDLESNTHHNTQPMNYISDDEATEEEIDDPRDPDFKVTENDYAEESEQTDDDYPGCDPLDNKYTNESANQENVVGKTEQTDCTASASHPTSVEEIISCMQSWCSPHGANKLVESEDKCENQEIQVREPGQTDHTACVSHPTDIEEIIPYAQIKESDSWFSPLERLQLEHQMRMHVQLLCQSFLLSYGIKQFEDMTSNSIEHLEQLAMLNTCSQQIILGNVPSFYACNLDEAQDIVKMVRKNEHFTNKFQQGKNDTSSISKDVMEIIAHSKVFIYPDLLPKVCYRFPIPYCKSMFAPYEDILIAMGLEEFVEIGDCYKYIHSVLMPSKTAAQIKYRTKNVRAAKQSDNPLKKYFMTHKWPQVPRYTAPFDPLCVIPPSSMPIDVLPPWMKPYVSCPVLLVVPPILKQQRKYTRILPKDVPKKQGVKSKPKKPVTICIKMVTKTGTSAGKEISISSERNALPSAPTGDTSVKNQSNPAQGVIKFQSKSINGVLKQYNVIRKPLVFQRPVQLRPIAKAPPKEDKTVKSQVTSTDVPNSNTTAQSKPKSTQSESKQPCDNHMSVNYSENSMMCSEKSKESPQQVAPLNMPNVTPLNIKSEPYDPGYAESDNEDVKISLNSNCLNEAALESNIETDNANSSENNLESLCMSVPYIKSEPSEDSDHCITTGSSKEWTKEEDYIVVDSCERYGLNMDAFMVAAAAISTKTVNQVKDRFFELMELTHKKNQDSDR